MAITKKQRQVLGRLPPLVPGAEGRFMRGHDLVAARRLVALGMAYRTNPLHFARTIVGTAELDSKAKRA